MRSGSVEHAQPLSLQRQVQWTFSATTLTLMASSVPPSVPAPFYRTLRRRTRTRLRLNPAVWRDVAVEHCFFCGIAQPLRHRRHAERHRTCGTPATSTTPRKVRQCLSVFLKALPLSETDYYDSSTDPSEVIFACMPTVLRGHGVPGHAARGGAVIAGAIRVPYALPFQLLRRPLS